MSATGDATGQDHRREGLIATIQAQNRKLWELDAQIKVLGRQLTADQAQNRALWEFVRIYDTKTWDVIADARAALGEVPE